MDVQRPTGTQMIGESPLAGRDTAVTARSFFLLFVVLAVLVAFIIVGAIATSSSRHHRPEGIPPRRTACTTDDDSLLLFPRSATATANCTVSSIPFLVIREPDWRIIPRTLDYYEKETHRALETLSIAMETLLWKNGGGAAAAAVDKTDDHHHQVDSSSTVVILADLLQEKIDRLDQLYAHDLAILRDVIIRPFPCRYMLPTSTSPIPAQQFTATRKAAEDEVEESIQTNHVVGASNNNSLVSSAEDEEPAQQQPLSQRRPLKQQFAFVPRQPPPSDETMTAAAIAASSYESIRQVIAHLVRDWSSLGASARAPLYDWCSTAIADYYGNDTSHNKKKPRRRGPILVPGAGLGRLAWQLAMQDGHIVEALESSTVMAAAAYTMYHYDEIAQSRVTIHPYAADPFSNEVYGRHRYTSCQVPDINTTNTMSTRGGGGRLSYTVAMFDLSAIPSDHYGAVVTCFFIDTATTLIDYISTIQTVLQDGGLWINVGPLQWHLNSKVPLAVDELQILLTRVYRFTVLHWSVDDKVLNYRDGDRVAGSTYADGYRPLRFILRWEGDA